MEAKCSEQPCAGKPSRKGMCERHYRADLNKNKPPCHCGLPSRTGGLCFNHYRQARVKVYDTKACMVCGTPVKLGCATCMTCRSGEARNSRWLNKDGYVVISRPGSPSADAQGRIMEHRWVMQQILGRPLLPNETVHHLNGDRSDNREENLQLWSKSQPPGQRVSDKVKWAEEILLLYKPGALKNGKGELHI